MNHRYPTVVAALFAVALLLPVTANAAPAGQITRATAEPQWTTGHITGSVQCDGCFGGPVQYARWLALVNVQPALPSYSCRGDDWEYSDPNIRIVWSSGTRTTNDAVAIDVPNALLLAGVAGQRACLLVIETIRRRNPVCVAQAPVLGLDPNVVCPLEDFITGRAVANRLFSVEQPPAPTPPAAPPPAPAAPPPQVVAPSVGPAAPPAFTVTIAAARVRTALANRYGRAWKRGRARRVRCRAADAERFRCVVSWRYKRRRYRGHVIATPSRTTIRVRHR